MNTFPYLLLAFLVVFTTTACEGDDELRPSFTVPDSYSFERAGGSTVDFSEQATLLAMAEEINSALLDFSRTEEELINMFNNPQNIDPFSDQALNNRGESVSSKVAASRDLFFSDNTLSSAIRADFEGWLKGQVEEISFFENQLAAPGQAGQIAEGSAVRYVNDWGLEYNEAFVKSLIGGLMYDQVVNNYLSTAVLDEGNNRDDNDLGITEDSRPYTSMEHAWDQAFGLLFGLSADPARPLTDLGSTDSYLNKYVNRVNDDPDYAGMARDLESDFRLGRAAITVGEYGERDARANRIKEILTGVLVIRSVYYLKQAEFLLRNNQLQPELTFHGLSEAYGFIYSMRFIRLEVAGQTVDYTTFSDNALATIRNADNGGFWGLDPDTLADLAENIATVFFIDLEEAAN